MSNICIIVDGYNAGRQFAKVRADYPSVQFVHVQSTVEPIRNLTPFLPEDYQQCFTYNGDIEQLKQALLAFKGDHTIRCVIPGAEVGVILADALSSALELPTSNGMLLSSARRNKFEMRKAIADADLKVPLFCMSQDLNEIEAWVKENRLTPVVIKPLDSAGTDGVFICRSPEEIRNAFDYIMGHRNVYGAENRAVLAEAFLLGLEYVVNSVSCNGIHHVNDIWVYRKKSLPGRGNIYDREELLSFDGPLQQSLISYVHRVLDVLQIKFGASHAEVIMTEDGPVLVEVGARISGATNVAASQVCVGHDAVHLTLDAYLNPDNFFAVHSTPNRLSKYAMVVDYATELDGVLVKESFVSQVRTLPSVTSVVLKVKPGEHMHPTTDLATSPAKIHLVHADPLQLQQDYLAIQAIGHRAFVVELAPEERQKRWSLEFNNTSGIPSSYRLTPSSAITQFFVPRLLLNETKDVLDLGCGTGRNSFFFAERGHRVTAIDVLPSNIEGVQRYAQSHGLTIRAICGDVTEELPLADHSVDIIIDIFCYKHQIDDRKRKHYRNEIARVLKEGGVYCLSLASIEDGYYGPLRQEGQNEIMDPMNNIPSILFNEEDIKREFSNFNITAWETVKKADVMHGKTYDRILFNIMMQFNPPSSNDPSLV